MSLLKKLKAQYKKFKSNNQAVTAIEYALIAAVLSVAVLGALNSLSTTLKNTYSTINSQLSSAT